MFIFSELVGAFSAYVSMCIFPEITLLQVFVCCQYFIYICKTLNEFTV